ncbi:MAG: NAD(P)H-hydrate epimerase [Dehalococcoidia bacterium]
MVPHVTVEQMREVDRLMEGDLGITLLQMMENAGRALATQARSMLGGSAAKRRVVLLAGRSGNGGGGLAAARRLAIWGGDVLVVLSEPESALMPAARHQVAIVRRIGIPVWDAAHAGLEAALGTADLVVDALIGYSLRGAPREPAASLIRAANGSRSPVLALDLPSGLDGDSGQASDPTIRASATLTLALPKVGLCRPMARSWVGDLYLADISVPEMVYRRIGISVGPIFATSDILHLATDERGEASVRGS